jgi:hypothetical protein
MIGPLAAPGSATDRYSPILFRGSSSDIAQHFH